MELSALTAMEPLLPGLGGGGGVGSGLFPDLLTLDGAGSGRSHHHHHLVKRTVWPGADSEMLFNSLVGPDTFPNFLAGSVTINAHRVVAHLTASECVCVCVRNRRSGGVSKMSLFENEEASMVLLTFFFPVSLFNWIFPATTGEIRATLEEITIFTDPQVQGFNIYVNVANMIYQIIGRFVVDVVLFGPQRTFEGIRSKSLRVGILIRSISYDVSWVFFFLQHPQLAHFHVRL